MNKLNGMASIGLLLFAVAAASLATAAPAVGTTKARGDYSFRAITGVFMTDLGRWCSPSRLA